MNDINSSPITPRVSPYARISSTDEERAPGIDRQFRTVHPLITSRNGLATRDYADNDKSAYNPSVIRDEGFEPWLQDFIDNKTDGIAAWDFDRVFRRNDDLERVISAYCHAYFKQKRTKPVFWLPSMSLDLTDEDGQMLARLLVTVSNNSSAKTVKRVSKFYRDEALQGRIYSNYPAFYRNQDGTLNHKKAAITLRAVRQVLLGVRPTTIAAEWREQGITTARGGHINGEGVRRILTSPGIAGLAVYQKELLIGEDGKPIKRVDGGLISESVWVKVCEKLKTNPGRRNRRTKALLSKFLRCGLCGSYMVRVPKSETFFMYSCRSVDSGGCAKISISGPRLDQQVTKLVLAYLDRPLETDSKPFEGQARLDEIAAKIAELMTAYRSGEMSGSLVFPSIKELEDEQRELQAQSASHKKVMQKVTTPAKEWEKLNLDRQQTIIGEIFECFVIMPADPAKPGVYNEDRVKPEWRSPEK